MKKYILLGLLVISLTACGASDGTGNGSTSTTETEKTQETTLADTTEATEETETSTLADEENDSESEDGTEQEDSEITNDDLIEFFNSMMTESFGEENTKVDYDAEANIFNIYVWEDGIDAELEMAQSGDADSIAAWDELREAMVLMTGAMKDLITVSESDASISVVVSSDADNERDLLVIVDYEITYDALQ